jgi:hypothetical protein
MGATKGEKGLLRNLVVVTKEPLLPVVPHHSDSQEIKIATGL